MKMLERFTLILVASVAFSSISTAQNLKADEVVLKHLESIGTKENRAGLTSLMAIGESEFESKIPIVKGGGRAVVVSNLENLFFVISLNSKEYPFERVGFFNGKVNLPYINAGTRSMLGLFIAEHEKILSDGIFGGSMSLRWAFWDEKRKPQVKLSGTKKINDRKVYVLNYMPSGGGSSEFSVRLYFDSESFNHVRSDYRREVLRGQGVFGQANQTANAVLQLTEDFSDFKTIDGLTLPHSYQVSFLSNSNTTSNENIWRINVGEYRLNQKLTPDFFTFSTS